MYYTSVRYLWWGILKIKWPLNLFVLGLFIVFLQKKKPTKSSFLPFAVNAMVKLSKEKWRWTVHFVTSARQRKDLSLPTSKTSWGTKTILDISYLNENLKWVQPPPLRLYMYHGGDMNLLSVISKAIFPSKC